jgi:hypothetical protein
MIYRGGRKGVVEHIQDRELNLQKTDTRCSVDIKPFCTLETGDNWCMNISII